MNSDAEKIQNLKLNLLNSAQRDDFFPKNWLIISVNIKYTISLSYLIENLTQITKYTDKKYGKSVL